MKNNKSQITIEFVTIIALGLIISISFTSFILYELIQNKNTHEYDSLMNIADIIKREIDVASISEDGYNRIFNLPDNILKKEYIIQVYNNTLISVKTTDREVLQNVHYFQGTLDKNNHIKKIGGIVKINT